ncbi:MAG: hypothetical protein IPO13_01695 [Rhodocyclaceae bacterium]|nr:hypothetical protein [Rhodocyclaceae bacterium]
MKKILNFVFDGTDIEFHHCMGHAFNVEMWSETNVFGGGGDFTEAHAKSGGASSSTQHSGSGK